MKKIAFTFLLLISLFACKNNDSVRSPEKEDASNIYNAEKDEMGMNQAIAKAKLSIGEFDKALQSKKYDETTFAIKVKFPTDDNGAEHIWMTDIVIEKGDYTGTVGNTPELTKKVKEGERMKINKADISDWMYVDKEMHLHGGETIKYIRSQKSKAEQKEFDKDFPYVIEQ
jgi:uncharacterized protein YegJ (DUF2314 family)